MGSQQIIETDDFIAEAFGSNSIVVTSAADPGLSVLIKTLPGEGIVMCRLRGNMWDILHGSDFERTPDGNSFEPTIKVRKM